jgi:hypothetical protein
MSCKDGLLKQWDVFLSHASEDQQTVALPLTDALRRAGVRVWLDKFQIEIGDSLRQKIDEGLANSRFGVVVLSEAFLTKHWTGRELDALWALDVVLPVWHGIDKKMLTRYSPLLAGKVGISTAEGIDVVAQTIAARLFKPIDGSHETSAHIAHDFGVLLARPTPVSELVDFVADHPQILTRSLGVRMDPEDLFRVAVPLGPNIVDFCVATFYDSIGELSDYQFVLFGPVDPPLFDDGRVGAALDNTLKRAKNIGTWLESNSATAREVLRDVPTAVLTKVVAGRRPQPGSPAVQALKNLNDDLIKVHVRTYDWLLDSALALAEGGDDQ